jgi:2Fe-2S ferredoxin
MPTITFLPSGVTIEVKPGTTVFQAAARAEVPIASQCGGKCACALCRVKVVDGQDLISPMGWEEESHMGNAFFITRQRLSCQLQIFGDVTIEVAEPEAKERAKSRYVPHSVLRKREKMEREADSIDAAGGMQPPPRRPAPPPGAGAGEAPPRAEAPPPKAPKSSPPKRRRRPRNPGAARAGDSRPTPGAKGER